MNDFRLIAVHGLSVSILCCHPQDCLLSEGEGTYFSRGMPLSNQKAVCMKYRITRRRGICWSWVVGMYDSNTKQADISGNLVPINLLSEIIGNATLAQFRQALIQVCWSPVQVNGHIDDLDVEVNPLTLLVPGLFRDLFSPNWLDPEADRLKVKTQPILPASEQPDVSFQPQFAPDHRYQNHPV